MEREPEGNGPVGSLAWGNHAAKFRRHLGVIRVARGMEQEKVRRHLRCDNQAGTCQHDATQLPICPRGRDRGAHGQGKNRRKDREIARRLVHRVNEPKHGGGQKEQLQIKPLPAQLPQEQAGRQEKERYGKPDGNGLQPVPLHHVEAEQVGVAMTLLQES